LVFIGALIAIGYFWFGKKNLILFLLYSIFVGGGGYFLIFGKIQGMGTIEFLGKFIDFILGSKKYLWKKKEFTQTEFLKKDSFFDESLKADKDDALNKIKKKKNIF